MTQNYNHKIPLCALFNELIKADYSVTIRHCKPSCSAWLANLILKFQISLHVPETRPQILWNKENKNTIQWVPSYRHTTLLCIASHVGFQLKCKHAPNIRHARCFDIAAAVEVNTTVVIYLKRNWKFLIFQKGRCNVQLFRMCKRDFKTDAPHIAYITFITMSSSAQK